MNMRDKMLGEQVVEEVKAMVGENVFSKLEVLEVDDNIIIAFHGINGSSEGFGLPLNKFQGNPREIAFQMLCARAEQEKELKKYNFDIKKVMQPEYLSKKVCAQVCSYDAMGAFIYKQCFISLYICINETETSCAMSQLILPEQIAQICVILDINFEDLLEMAVNNTVTNHKLRYKEIENEMDIKIWHLLPYLSAENIFMYQNNLAELCKRNAVKNVLLIAGKDGWFCVQIPDYIGNLNSYVKKLAKDTFKENNIHNATTFNVNTKKFEVLS